MRTESPIKEFHFSDTYQLDSRELKNTGKSRWVRHPSVTVMAIRGSMFRKETFYCADNTEVTDEREKHPSLANSDTEESISIILIKIF